MTKTLWLALPLALGLTACDTMPIQMGGAPTTATGAAAGATAQNANPDLERCAKPLGTLALDEDTSAPWYWRLTNEYKLTSTRPVLRMLVQQSNCFVVVERSASGMGQMQRERALMESGELRGGSNFGKGQMVAADYAMSPNIVFSANDTGGLGGAIGGRLGGSLGAAVLGSVKFREANTILTLVDNRSGVQVAVSEGSSKKADLGLFGGLLGGSAAGGLGGYTKTPEGKVIAAAFTDAYNQMVRAVKDYRPQDAAGPGGHGTGGALQVR
ncbi:MAG: CsgG/HfaB family protein [Thiotrichales bacterium]